MENSYNELIFRERISKALELAKRVLDTERDPKLPSDISHEWADKYHIADYCINSTLATFFNMFSKLGLSSDKMLNLHNESKKKRLTLSFVAKLQCDLIEKTSRVEKSKSSTVIKNSIIGTSKIFTETKIDEWHWKVTHTWSLGIFTGANSADDGDKSYPVLDNSTSCKITTQTENTPYSQILNYPVTEMDVSILFKNFQSGQLDFKIDRSKTTCFTPRRNEQYYAIQHFCSALFDFNEKIRQHYNNIGAIDGGRISSQLSDSVPIACLPTLETKSESKVSTLADDTEKLLKVSWNAIESKLSILKEEYSLSNKILNFKDASFVAVFEYKAYCALNLDECMDYLEDMIRSQVIAALGKHMEPKHLDQFMIFHNERFFQAQFSPIPFCFPVRRPLHVPEGVVSIEVEDSSTGGSEPIRTFLNLEKGSSSSPCFYFPLDAATKVAFRGDRFVHGFIATSFQDSAPLNLSVRARARQFSSFILLLGTLTAKDTFSPSHAIIIQNKDSIVLQLLTEVIPSAKAFKKAISSLSPEQQRFASAFRSMQLSSTLFALCIVQIKPQMERVLNLPPDSLTKEIALTQDLMKLFIDYQIPSDLLSFDPGLDSSEFELVESPVEKKGAILSSLSAKIDFVRKNVAAMKEMIESEKNQQLEKERLEAEKIIMDQVDFQPLMSRMAVPCPMPKKMARQQIPMSAPGQSMLPPPPPPCMPSMSAPPPCMASMAPTSMNAIYSDDFAAPVSQHLSEMEGYSAPSDFPEVSTGAGVSQEHQSSGPKTSESSPKINENPEDRDLQRPAPQLADLTTLPSKIDQMFENFDTEGAVRPTILKAADTLRKKYHQGLLGKELSTALNADDQKTEKNKAFDLIDALTKSGALELNDTSLHIVIAATHNFEKSLMDVIVQENTNPIEKISSTGIIMASAVHGVSFKQVVSKPQELQLYYSHFDIKS